MDLSQLEKGVREAGRGLLLKAIRVSRLSPAALPVRDLLRLKSVRNDDAERTWVRTNRPPAAAHWRVLTTLTAQQLPYAAQ